MPPLKITILGAGISGLTCALALRQQGHIVTILEKAESHQEEGAAIGLGPNCSGILIHLGVDPERMGANLFTGMAQFEASGATKHKIDLSEASKQWANPWLSVHRLDLHRELKRLVVDPEGEGLVPEIMLGCHAVDIDGDKGVVKLEDGRHFESDAIIGADGGFSFARKHIDPDATPFPWAKTSYRWLIPREPLVADPELSDLVGGDGWFTEVSGVDRRFVMYPCRSNSMMNFVAFVPNAETGVRGGDWHQEVNKHTLLKVFERFAPEQRKLLSLAPDKIKAWQLYDMDTLKTWSKGRLAVIGDAAHPFLPFLAQGGAIAIEDAASIAQILPKGTTATEVPDRLRLYQQIRFERVTWIQDQTRNNGLDEDKRPAAQGGFTMLQYCHAFDEWENTRLKLDEWLKSRKQVNG